MSTRKATKKPLRDLKPAGEGVRSKTIRMTSNKMDPDYSTVGAPTFVEVFAGCGGLTLGLLRAGWKGLFAVEQDRFAFETLRANFLEESARYRYEWPTWLSQEPRSVESLLSLPQLKRKVGKLDLLAGGPPCQGFSSAGRRRVSDPRNALIERYLDVVETLSPRYVLLENVLGFTRDFKKVSSDRGGPIRNYAQYLASRLKTHYDLFTTVLMASEYGVPQARRRFILIGVRRARRRKRAREPSFDLRAARDAVLARHALRRFVTAREAISDLKTTANGTVASAESPGFEAIAYVRPRNGFQRAMRDNFDAAPSDTRLARHAPKIARRFSRIIKACEDEQRSTRQLSPKMRSKFGLRKIATRVLDPRKPAPTITSMPDDLIHYCEPRTLTVRENARLQTFPDWFVFRGKYTTGGPLRKKEVPRFTQVANAVPPVLAEMLGTALLSHLRGANTIEIAPESSGVRRKKRR